MALLLATLLAGCTAPPEKPPKPKPLNSQSQPHPPGAMTGNAHAGGEGGPGAPGSAQGYGAASANAAEVQEEEVAADGTTRVISSSHHAPPAAAGASGGHGNGAGGAAMPASSSGHGGAGHSGGGPQGNDQPAGPAYSDMTGIDPGAAGAAADPDADAAAQAGRAGASATRKLPAPVANDADRRGVRGGRDESGASAGTALTSAPPRQREQVPLRENDLLARQLREAAEKEKDPVLREKLWAEYRKYKAGL